MKFNSLRDFVAVAERGSLRSAARQLEVSQPAITRSIQELEKELGVALFERRTKGVGLTAIGEVFFRRAKAIRQELTRAQDEVFQMRGLLNGHVNVCLSSVVHMALYPNVLRPFRQRYPNVVIDVYDSLLPSIEWQLLDGTIDCYVGPAFDEMSGDLRVEKLFDNTRIIVGRKGHPLAGARSLAELTQADWAVAAITHRTEEELSPLFAEHGLPSPKVVVRTHSALSIVATMAYSDLLMYLPAQWAQMPLFRDSLQRIDVEETLPAPPICIVQRSGLPLTPAAEYFCDMVRRASLHMDSLLIPA